MPGKLLTALSALIVVAVPVALVGNSVWLLLGPWLVDAQYALPGFPVDPDGLQGSARAELAKTGVESVRPAGAGVELLREARLPDGAPAFDAREVSHMAEVRAVMRGLLVAWLAAVAALAVSCLALRRAGEWTAATRALRRGALLTLAAIALTGLVMAVSFETFFDAFHALFFEGDTWRFSNQDTLRQLYPDAFWAIAATTAALLITLQAAALAYFTGRARRDDSSTC